MDTGGCPGECEDSSPCVLRVAEVFTFIILLANLNDDDDDDSDSRLS